MKLKSIDCSPYKMTNKSTGDVSACKCLKHHIKFIKNLHILNRWNSLTEVLKKQNERP